MYQKQTTEESAVELGEAMGRFIVKGGMVCLSFLPFILCGVSLVQAKKRGEPGWKLAAVIFGLFGLLTLSCTGLILANMPDDNELRVTPELPMEFSPSGQSVTSTDRRMKLDLHGDWEGTTDLLSEAVIELEEAVWFEYLTAFTYDKVDCYEQLDQCADSFTDQYLNENEENQLVSRERVQIGGYDAVRVVLDSNFDGDLMVQLLVTIEVGDTYFLLMGWGWRTHREHVLSSLDQVIATLQVVGE